jgi:hypothetical protein
MKLKEIIDQFTDEEILKRLFEVYPDQKRSKEGYLKALTALRKLKPVKYDMIISPRKFSTDGYDTKKKETYAIEFNKWEYWLGSEIKTHRDKLTALCFCLWEMTFYGYSQAPIQRQINSLNKIVADIDKKEIAP